MSPLKFIVMLDALAVIVTVGFVWWWNAFDGDTHPLAFLLSLIATIITCGLGALFVIGLHEFAVAVCKTIG
jgi:hypothetical protein